MSTRAQAATQDDTVTVMDNEPSLKRFNHERQEIAATEAALKAQIDETTNALNAKNDNLVHTVTAFEGDLEKQIKAYERAIRDLVKGKMPDGSKEPSLAKLNQVYGKAAIAYVKEHAQASTSFAQSTRNYLDTMGMTTTLNATDDQLFGQVNEIEKIGNAKKIVTHVTKWSGKKAILEDIDNRVHQAQAKIFEAFAGKRNKQVKEILGVVDQATEKFNERLTPFEQACMAANEPRLARLAAIEVYTKQVDKLHADIATAREAANLAPKDPKVVNIRDAHLAKKFAIANAAAVPVCDAVASLRNSIVADLPRLDFIKSSSKMAPVANDDSVVEKSPVAEAFAEVAPAKTYPDTLEEYRQMIIGTMKDQTGLEDVHAMANVFHHQDVKAAQSELMQKYGVGKADLNEAEVAKLATIKGKYAPDDREEEVSEQLTAEAKPQANMLPDVIALPGPIHPGM